MPHLFFFFFFFNDTATTEIYTLSLHDALPISFGALIGVFIGALIGRPRAARNTAAPVAPPPPVRFAPPEVQHVVLDEGSANVLNALINRLAAIGALTDLLHGSPPDPLRARPCLRLHGE